MSEGIIVRVGVKVADGVGVGVVVGLGVNEGLEVGVIVAVLVEGEGVVAVDVARMMDEAVFFGGIEGVGALDTK